MYSSTYRMDTTSYLNPETAEHQRQEQPKKSFCDTSDLKTIKIFPSPGTEFNPTAEDLLNTFLPFGCVISAQKTVKDGLVWGRVTYSNAHDAAMAVMKLQGAEGFIVSLLHHREAHKNERSERASDRPPCVQQDRFSNMTQRIPSLLGNPPVYDQDVCLHIQNLPIHFRQRQEVLSLLPPCTTNVKVEQKGALVTLPDYSTALWLMDFLNNFYTGSKRLYVSFANKGREMHPRERRALGQRHQRHQGLF
ncbi:uncharacterized protein LOC126407122 [Epinephelus moara]|uniref:uncharacterized protein LOC126407122 n=1 Tax=Epinephelus moara TaxID=300413 RepID=UPI00214EBF54|nr:uncharacterized protein LOC126407122 [Epinephelus moara]